MIEFIAFIGFLFIFGFFTTFMTSLMLKTNKTH